MTWDNGIRGAKDAFLHSIISSRFRTGNSNYAGAAFKDNIIPLVHDKSAGSADIDRHARSNNQVATIDAVSAGDAAITRHCGGPGNRKATGIISPCRPAVFKDY
jgi:hypothetical protein